MLQQLTTALAASGFACFLGLGLALEAAGLDKGAATDPNG
jgi:hypothetical protein